MSKNKNEEIANPIQEILEFCSRLQKGDFSKRLSPSQDFGDLKAIVPALNQLATKFEHQAHESDHRFHSLFETETAAIVFAGLDGTVIEGNQKYADLYGISRQELIGKRVTDLICPEDREENDASIKKLLSGEIEKFTLERRFPKSDSSVGWCSLNVSLIRNRQGEKVCMVGILQNITDQKLAEDQHRESEKLYRMIVENAQEGIWSLDSEFRIIYTNPRLSEILGYTPDDFRGRFPEEFMFEGDVALYRQELKKRILGESSTYELRFIHKDGSTVYTQISGAPQIEKNGSLVGVCALITDITERKKTEIKLFHLNQTLERQVNEKTSQLLNSSKLTALGEMAGGIAHEINNPLAIIAGKAENLRSKLQAGSFDQKYFEIGIEKIISTSNRIASIINGLRKFACDDSDEPMIRIEITKILDDSIALCRERFRGKGIDLRVIALTDINIICHPIQISQVIINLLNNAFDAVKQSSEKWIQISVENTNSGNVQIKITDSGPGISTEVSAKIMQPFFTTKPIGQGTGLGLSISKGLVEQNGGKLYYDPAATHTCFVIELPTANNKISMKSI